MCIIVNVRQLLINKIWRYREYEKQNLINDGCHDFFDNAIKYSKENGQIDISLIKSKRQVIYSIKNSGKGIAKQDLPKVFDRFYRADPSRTHENGGYGLGLSIAKAIIDGLGGETHATSVENEYTTFTFTLGL